MLTELFNIMCEMRVKSPNKIIIFGSIIPRIDVNSKVVAKFNYEIKKFCKNQGFVFFDCFHSFSKVDYSLDGIHLNKKGKVLLGQLLNDFLLQEFLKKKVG